MDQAVTTDQPAKVRHSIAGFLSLERNVSLASAAVFILGLGEELWKKFLPKYIEALGASAPIIGLFGTAEDFFDAIYQYPGGWQLIAWAGGGPLRSWLSSPRPDMSSI